MGEATPLELAEGDGVRSELHERGRLSPKSVDVVAAWVYKGG